MDIQKSPKTHCTRGSVPRRSRTSNFPESFSPTIFSKPRVTSTTTAPNKPLGVLHAEGIALQHYNQNEISDLEPLADFDSFLSHYHRFSRQKQVHMYILFPEFRFGLFSPQAPEKKQDLRCQGKRAGRCPPRT